MAPGYRGTYVISWSQTEANGFCAPRLDLVTVGANWRWQGTAIRLDHPGVFLLESPQGGAELHRRAARMVRRLVGSALEMPAHPVEAALEDTLPDQGFVLTDGRQTFQATLIPVPDSAARLVMFAGQMPPANRDLWVVKAMLDAPIPKIAPTDKAMICFASGTRIATPKGPRLIEDLQPGDLVLTLDNGPQPIQWVGTRRVGGARLYTMPQLRPIRIRAGALGIGRPDGDLRVSPDHRMLLRGRAAQALFGVPEVLVRAKDLIDDRGIQIDSSFREVRYVHLLLERHQILFANGLESESFHPESADPETVDPQQRLQLQALWPDIGAYGGFARRNLSAAEAAILRHQAA